MCASECTWKSFGERQCVCVCEREKERERERSRFVLNFFFKKDQWNESSRTHSRQEQKTSRLTASFLASLLRFIARSQEASHSSRALA